MSLQISGGYQMKIALVYDSVSSEKLTAKVAEVIAKTLRGKGLEVTSVPVGDAKHLKIEEYDALVIGTPTMAWGTDQAGEGVLGSFGRQQGEG